jgi:hypothetical protein
VCLVASCYPTVGSTVRLTLAKLRMAGKATVAMVRMADGFDVQKQQDFGATREVASEANPRLSSRHSQRDVDQNQSPHFWRANKMDSAESIPRPRAPRAR